MDPPEVSLPVNLQRNPKYAKMEQAIIYKVDRERIEVIDALLHNLYTVYVLLIDRSFSDAFIKVFINIVMCREFNEFKLLIKHIQIFTLLLLKLEKRMEAVRVYEFLRDLTEDTQ